MSNNISKAIILSATLYGSIYLFSKSTKCWLNSIEKYGKNNTPNELINMTIMLSSGIVVLLTGIKAINLLDD